MAATGYLGDNLAPLILLPDVLAPLRNTVQFHALPAQSPESEAWRARPWLEPP